MVRKAPHRMMATALAFAISAAFASLLVCGETVSFDWDSEKDIISFLAVACCLLLWRLWIEAANGL